jgi:Ferric reductase like transmembrane component
MLVLAASPSAYWFITRATGAITLILLTVSLAIGVANVRRERIAGLPRFVLDSVHRNASLLALAFLFVHVVTTLLDGFAPIGLLDVVVPFHSAYRPIWLGLGAIAFDLMIAVMITSLLRARLGYRSWRITHWLSYACWPIALVHGLGTGSDTKAKWMLLLTVACVAVVVVAVVARVASGWPAKLPARVSALGAAALLPIGLVVWLPEGPLGKRWAERAGTPASVLAKALAQAGGTPVRSRGGSAATAASSSFTANVTGTVRQSELPSGRLEVAISLSIAGQQLNALRVKLDGEAIPGGGVQMQSSSVTLGPSSDPRRYAGRVTALRDTNINAVVSNAGGSSLEVLARLQVNPGPGTAVGTVTVEPVTRSP